MMNATVSEDIKCMLSTAMPLVVWITCAIQDGSNIFGKEYPRTIRMAIATSH